MCDKLDLDKLNNSKDNSMLRSKLELYDIWNFDKNKDIDIYEVTKGSSKKVWWNCDKCEDSYPMSINKKVTGRGCSICSGYYVTQKNSFGGIYSELIKEWHPHRNGSLTPYDVSKRSSKKVWWKCDECNSDYDMSVDKKSGENANCPYCRGLRVNNTNSLLATNPRLAKLWDYSKNGKLTPSDVTSGSGVKVYWKCNVCGDESISSVNSKRSCAVCAGQKVKVGYNDLWTTCKEVAELLEDCNDGFTHMKYSNKKLKFKCINCDCVEEKLVSGVTNRGYSCSICSDGKSFGERVVYEILTNADLNFKSEKTFNWSNNKRYDFYIPKFNCIIEVQGEQHYNGSFSKMNGRTLLEEVDNDIYKETIAKENGIVNYYRLKSESYNLESLKYELRISGLADLLNIEDCHIESVNKFNSKPLTLDVWFLYNKGLKVMEIVNELNISKTTVRKYLKLGKSLNKCNYEPRARSN